MAIQHADSAQIHKFAYVQPTDPGAVGAQKGWVDTSNPTAFLKVRNDANSGWVNLGVLGSSIVGSPANSLALLQRTRWVLTEGTTINVLTVPFGKNAILNKIVVTALADATALNPDELSFTAGAQNLTGQVYDRPSIYFGDFAKGLGLAGPGYAGSIQGRYDPDTGFIYEFGIIDTDLYASTTNPGFIPHALDIFVFGTMIDAIL